MSVVVSAAGKTLMEAASAASQRTALGVDALDASSITSGTVAAARLGSGSGGASKFLREDSTWQTVSGSGDVTAAAVIADNAVVRGDGGAKGVQSSAVTVSDNGEILCAAGGTADAPIKFQAGTNLTTAEAGALEFATNQLYATATASHRGSWVTEHWIRQAENRTLASSGSEQKLFDSVTNGTLTLPTGVYFFECMIYVTGLSATSGNAAFTLISTGTAVLADQLFHVIGVDNTTPTNAATQTGSFSISSKSVASAVTAGTGTGFGMSIRGSFEVTTGGTIIPSIHLVTAAAGTLRAGSYFKCHRVGQNGDVSCGAWS